MDDHLLSGFPQFVTGSNIISLDRIQVSFHANDSALRYPVPHTCGPLLVIPSTYQSYNEFHKSIVIYSVKLDLSALFRRYRNILCPCQRY